MPKTSIIKKNSCLVCGGVTKHLHYQIASCRACATFFKRSSELGISYKCKIGTKQCKLTKSNGKRLCRYCRLQKCKQLGMKLENGKYFLGKDTSKSVPSTSIGTQFSDVTATSSVISRVPSIERFPHSRLMFKEDGKIGIDMAPLEALINEILNSPNANPIAPGIKLTFMQQLNYGFTLFNSEFKPKEPVTVTNEVDRYALFKHHEKFMVVLAKILMLCDKFACLDFNDKFILFKNSWYIFYHIERHYTSIEYFGKAKEDLRVLVDDKIAIDYDVARYHLKDIDRKVFAINLNRWMSYRNKFIKHLMNPMKDLQITQYEIAFLLSQLLWNVQAWEGLSEEAVKIAEQVNEQIAIELHNYYVYEKGIVIYADRLMKLIKLVEVARDLIQTKKELFLMEQIFDSFDITIFESPLYDWKKI